MKKVLKHTKGEKGSVELIVIGLLAALIIVLAIPLLDSLGSKSQSTLTSLNTTF